MEELQKKGLTKHIGVSNFNCQLLNDLLSYADIPPLANQIEIHPYYSQKEFLDFMIANEVIPISYASLGSRQKLESANKH